MPWQSQQCDQNRIWAAVGWSRLWLQSEHTAPPSFSQVHRSISDQNKNFSQIRDRIEQRKREVIQYVLRNVLKRYEKFENENFLLRPWFDYVKDRQLGLIRGWCRVDIGLIKGYRGVTWPLMMTNSLISSPIIFCWGHFRHLAPSHISATSQLFLTSLDARRFWQFLTQRFLEEVWKQGKGKTQSNWLWR